MKRFEIGKWGGKYTKNKRK